MDRYFFDPLQENLDRIFAERSEYANEVDWDYWDQPKPLPRFNKYELADAVALAWKYNEVQTRKHKAKRKAALQKHLLEWH